MANNPVENNPKPDRDSFTPKAVTLIGATVLVAAGLAFVAIPAVLGREEGLDVFAAICRAMGLTVDTAKPVALQTSGSTVAIDRATRLVIASGDAAKGEALAADVCGGCHLPNGESSDPATIPTIAGQSPRAIFKQLKDIKAGVRVNEAMIPIVEGLDDQQMSDLAAYFGGLKARNYNNPETPAISPATLDLIKRGDTSRALPACVSCHEARAGGPWEAPNLAGQYPTYIETQLKAFASGERRNDLYARMRTITKKLTPKEISELSGYYNGPAYPF